MRIHPSRGATDKIGDVTEQYKTFAGIHPSLLLVRIGYSSSSIKYIVFVS